MPRTTNKGIRFTDDELRHIQQLRPQLPEYSSEADLLHHAALLGVLVLATYATRPGLPAYAGYVPDDLAALLRPRLMPAIDFLQGQGALPAMWTAPGTSDLGATATETAQVEPMALPAIDEGAVEDLEGLGTGFMDDE
jgi:hypothetical protein